LAAWSTGILFNTLGVIEDSNPAGCAKGGHYWIFNPDYSTTDYMLALAAEARATGSPLKVGINGCYKDRPQIVVVNR